jgi:hypothetical protein
MGKLFGVRLLHLPKLNCPVSADQRLGLVCALTIQTHILIHPLPAPLPIRPVLQVLLCDLVEIVLV